MDFRFSDEQNTIRELARGIFEKEVTPERQKAAEATPERIDDVLWKTLAEANLLGIAVPEEHGGMGLGLLELCTLLEEWGRAVAPVPAFAALLLGGLPIARFGTNEQRARWLPGLASGTLMLSAALQDAGSEDPAAPATVARRDGTDFLLTGAKRLVPLASRAARIVVPAAVDDGVALFLVDPNASGVHLTPQRVSTKEPLFDLVLEGVRVGRADVFGDASAARWLRDAALAALCTTQVGVSERALEITAKYLRERVQFGVPIGSFQSVQHRAADCWIDAQAMRWTAWRAATRLVEGSDVSRDTAVAKLWAAEGGSRIANAAQHMHGGIGVDVDYPIHRYFLWSKSLELTLGSATPHLARLGRNLANSLPAELA
jgi:alkylation response protein AidB-like acyl-CoA dehydrogenase